MAKKKEKERLITVRNGSYRVKLFKKGMDKPITQTFSTMEEAVSFRGKVELAIKTACVDAFAADMVTVEYAFNYYVEKTSPKKDLLSKINNIEKVLEYLGFLRIPLATLDLKKIKLFVNQRMKFKNGKAYDTEVISAKTVNDDIGVCRRVMKKIIYDKTLGITNPFNDVAKLDEKPIRRGRFKGDSYEKVIAAIPKVKEYAKKRGKNPVYIKDADYLLMPFIMKMAIKTGLRRGELAELRLDQIVFNEDGKILLLFEGVETKNESAKLVYIVPSFHDEFKLFYDERKSELLEQYGDEKEVEESFFNIHKDTISKIFLYAKELAGVDTRLVFHCTRHEATSILVEKGMTAVNAMKMTGHKTLGMLSHYSHLEVAEVIANAEKNNL